MHVCPERHENLFDSDRLARLCPDYHPETLELYVEKIPDDDPLKLPLTESGINTILRIPVYSARNLIGTFVLFDLPDPNKSDEISAMMEFLKPTLGLTIQNCMARQEIEARREQLEKQVEQRTEELQEANRELNQARLAALNMMEDAVRSKQQAEKSEARLKRAQQIARVGDWEFDLQAGAVNASDSARTIYGLSGDDLNVENVQKLPLPEYRPVLDAALKDLIEKGKPYDVEFTIRRPSDQALIEIHSTAEYNPETQTVFGVIRDISERKRLQEAIEKRIVALTRPLEDSSVELTFDDLFNLEEIQRIQDEFAAATGVAAIITLPDGTPITQPSNFTRLCSLIRQTETGYANCLKSDAVIGRFRSDGPIVQPCLSGGLWDAGASIEVGGRHIANWLIGQVRDDTRTEEHMRAYAREIGVDEAECMEAFHEVPVMSQKHFEEIARALFTLTKQLSTSAYQNVQQARFIADQKKTEAALKESEARYKSLHNASFGGIAIHDRGIILECNQGLADMTGYSLDELIGMNGLELIAPDFRDRVMEKIKSGYEKPYEADGLRKNGETYPLRLEAHNVPYKGKPARTVEFRDLTTIKQTEDELLRLSTAIEQSPVTVVITDPEGTIEYVNPAFETVTGYTREEAMGQNPRILQSGKQSEAFYADMWKTLETGEIWSGRLVNKRKDETFYTEDASIAPVKDKTGTITHYVGIKRDITDEIARNEQLQKTQKLEAVGQLAGGIAHDFNNILQAILGFSEILMMQIDESAEQPRKNLQEIQKGAKHAAELTQQMLSFSRKQPIQFSTIDLNPAVKNSLSLIKSVIGENVRVKANLSPEPLPVSVDTSQLERTLLNMALNARDAMPKGGTLTLETKAMQLSLEDTAAQSEARPGAFACLTLRDTGTGMSPQVLNHLFEPFFTTKEPGKGTGLGLAAIYGIIQAHNGWISAASEPGTGSTFSIYLPLSDATPETENLQADLAELPRSSDNGSRVLVAEDDRAIRTLTENALNHAGYQVDCAASAEKAEELFDRYNGDFDLLISDVILPGKNGAELAASLTKKKPTLRVIFCSGYSSDQIKKAGIDEKNFTFLSKPFSIVELLKATQQVFKSV